MTLLKVLHNLAMAGTMKFTLLMDRSRLATKMDPYINLVDLFNNPKLGRNLRCL